MKVCIWLVLILIFNSACGVFWGSITDISPYIAPANVSVGVDHSCYRSQRGTLRCWGAGGSGKLGHNDTNPVGDGSVPYPTIQSAGDIPVGVEVVEISAGNGFTCARIAGWALRCWGNNGSGQLGRNNTTDVGDGIGPTIIAAGDIAMGGPVVQISSGLIHACAVLNTGALRCWGSGLNGRLGHDDTNPIGNGVGLSIIAAGDIPVGGAVSQVAAGSVHTCAVLTTGAVRCWGLGTFGVLGHDSAATIGNGVGQSIIAAGDIPVGGRVIQVVTGTSHTCALLEGGNMRCWGLGSNGRLGYNGTTSVGNGVGPSIIAAGDVPVGGTVTQITAGATHTCARLSTGNVRCWGDNIGGRLGYGHTNDIGNGVGQSIIQAGDVPIGGTVVQVVAGGTQTCALLTAGSVRCWGVGGSGQLGHGDTNPIANGSAPYPTIESAGDIPY